jgi:zinc protease
MQVVVIEDHRSPAVVHMVWYRAGAADEPPGQSGVAHFLEHLMFKGTDELESGEFSDIVEANGGSDNAFTSWDYTGYFQRVAADRLGLMMEMEADRMRDLRFADEEVVTERSVILEERAERVDSSAGGLFNEQMRATLFNNHPYGIPIIGWRHEMEQLDREALIAFYEDHYWPNNAILIVAGDVTPMRCGRLAETHYGPIPANPDIEPRVRPQEPPQIADRRLVYEDERVANPYVARAYLVPPRASRAISGSAAALTMLAEILGGSGQTSVSPAVAGRGGTRALRRRLLRLDQLRPSSFNLVNVPVPGVSLEEAEADLDRAIAQFLRGRHRPGPVRAHQVPDRGGADLRGRQRAGPRPQLRGRADQRPDRRRRGCMARRPGLRDHRRGDGGGAPPVHRHKLGHRIPDACSPRPRPQAAMMTAAAEEVSCNDPPHSWTADGAILLLPGAARAIDIQEVTSPGGIEAWLVEDNSIPFVAIEIWFNGGASLDAPGKRGAVHLMTGSSGRRRRGHGRPRLRRSGGGLAASFEFDVYRDALTVSARMLTENRDEAADLLRAALVRRASTRTRWNGCAGRSCRSSKATRATPTRSRADLQRHGLGRSPLWQRAGRHAGKRQCADPRRSGGRAPRRAGTRPRDRGRRRRHHGRGAGRAARRDPRRPARDRRADARDGGVPAAPGTTVVDFPSPQSVALFGHQGIARDDPDFFPPSC